MSLPMIDAELQEIIGDPKEALEESRQFSETAQLLSQSEIYERYKGEWVALYDRDVRAHSKTLKGILKQVDVQGLPRGQTLIHFIDDGTRTLILHASR